MIKIIKEGTRKQIECPECGCLFSYEQSDIEEDYVYNGIGARSLKSSCVECPQCKNDVIIKKER